LVSLIGIITRGDPLVLILQFCAEGELLGMLKKAAAEGARVSLMDKMQMAREIAQGMDHLSKNHFVHRDLSCRNVLQAGGMCKIADFGLSRSSGHPKMSHGYPEKDTMMHRNPLRHASTASMASMLSYDEEHEDYYKSTAGVFPVRWTAPEAMESLRFTTASDVWSFGIVVIELLTDGVTPYHGMSNPDVMKLTMSGGKHEKPPMCSNKLYAVLLRCFDEDHEQRPDFAQLSVVFKDMYTVNSKSADANTERVEAAANHRLKQGEAANEYTAFDGSPGGDNTKVNATYFGQDDSGQVVHNPLFAGRGPEADSRNGNAVASGGTGAGHGKLATMVQMVVTNIANQTADHLLNAASETPTHFYPQSSGDGSKQAQAGGARAPPSYMICPQASILSSVIEDGMVPQKQLRLQIN
jgi:serine/threonine protein kinase